MGCLKLTYHEREEALEKSSLFIERGLEKNACEEKKCVTGYRYGFNGQERDNEIAGAGNVYDLGLREYDTRLGRMFSIDPRAPEYSWQSPYVYHRNSPISSIDYMGGGDPQITYPFSGINSFSPILYGFRNYYNGILNSLTASWKNVLETKYTEPKTPLSKKVTVINQGFSLHINFESLQYLGGNNTIVYPKNGLIKYEAINEIKSYTEIGKSFDFKYKSMPMEISYNTKAYDGGGTSNTATVSTGFEYFNVSIVQDYSKGGINSTTMNLNLVVPLLKLSFPKGKTLEQNFKSTLKIGIKK